MTSEQLAWKIRRHAVEMTHLSGGSHIGSILSVADIIAVLYNDIAHVDPKNPKMENRDRIILSKGHAGAAIYAALAEKGFFPVEVLKTHYQNGSILSGHVSHKDVPGVEISTGSLGHGLSIGSGMAYAAKIDKKKHKVYVILGDGENDEGSVWEAALVSNHFKLNNLIAIVDYNKMQSLDFVENTISLAPLDKKWEAFGWHVININGHNHDDLRQAFIQANESQNKPTMILAHTIKGKGISFMENNILWHYRFPHKGEEYDNSLKELEQIMPIGTIDPYKKGKKI
jgi:transketolase